MTDLKIEHQIENLLKHSIAVKELSVENESHNHAGNRNDTHYKVIIVSDDFKDKKMLARHQWINQILKEIFNQVHALSIRSYSLEEWNNLSVKPVSPICASKK